MHAGSPRDAINVSNTNKDGPVLDVFSCVWDAWGGYLCENK